MSLTGNIILTSKAVWKLIMLAETNTYYPEVPRKSKLRIAWENMLWTLKKREVNYYYYMQGFDRKDAPGPDHYFARPEFVRLRDRFNAGIYSDKRKANYTCLLQDKFLFSRYLDSLGFKAPVTLALCDGETITWLDNDRQEPLEKLADHEGLHAFIKPAVGWQGENVCRIEVRNKTLYLSGRETPIRQLAQNIKDRFIIQERIIQHPDMQRLYPHSVNTLRIVTARKGDDISLLSSVCRIGAGGNVRDNWCSGGIAVGIDKDSGILQKYGFFNPKYGRKVTCHPDTNVPLEGFSIPYYHDAVQTARQLHLFFYGLHSVGWDIAITQDGPVFIEGNDDWGIRVIQPHDPDLKKRFLGTLPDAINK